MWAKLYNWVMTDTDPMERAKCGAKKKESNGGGFCNLPSGHGTNHPGLGPCKHHMGCTPAVITAANKVKARRAVETFGLPRNIDPRDALLEEVYRTAGAVDWLQRRIAEMDPEALVWGTTEIKQSTGKDGDSITQAAEINGWLQVYQKERRHLVEVSKAAIAAGIEERRVRVAEQQGNLLATAIRAILGDLELTPEQESKVPSIVPQRLRELTAIQAGVN